MVSAGIIHVSIFHIINHSVHMTKKWGGTVLPRALRALSSKCMYTEEKVPLDIPRVWRDRVCLQYQHSGSWGRWIHEFKVSLEYVETHTHTHTKQNKSESKAPLHETSKGFCNRHVSVLSQLVPGSTREWVTWFLNTWLMLHLYGSSRIIIVLWRGLPLTNYQNYREMKKSAVSGPLLGSWSSPCHSASVTTGHCKGTRWSNVDLKYPLTSSLARRHWG